MPNAEGRMEDDFGRMALDAWWHAVHSSRLSHDDALLAALKGFRLYTERMADALAARTREVEEMREALTHYANSINWMTHTDQDDDNLRRVWVGSGDGREYARRALAAQEGA